MQDNPRRLMSGWVIGLGPSLGPARKCKRKSSRQNHAMTNRDASWGLVRSMHGNEVVVCKYLLCFDISCLNVCCTFLFAL